MNELFTSSWDKCFVQNSVNVNTAPPLTCGFIVLQNIINASLVLSAIVALFLILFSAYQYVTSAGDKEKIDKARKRITYAIIGLIIIFFSFTIINLISTFTGVSLNQLGIGQN